MQQTVFLQQGKVGHQACACQSVPVMHLVNRPTKWHLQVQKAKLNSVAIALKAACTSHKARPVFSFPLQAKP